MDRTTLNPITDAVYGRKAAHRKPPANKPVRKARETTVGEAVDAHTAAALVALRAELLAATPIKKRRPRAKRVAA